MSAHHHENDDHHGHENLAPGDKYTVQNVPSDCHDTGRQRPILDRHATHQERLRNEFEVDAGLAGGCCQR